MNKPQISLFFDGVSVRRVAKGQNTRVDYKGLWLALTRIWDVNIARLYTVRDTAVDSTMFDKYMAQVKSAGFEPLVVEIKKEYGYYDFSPQLTMDALAATTPYVGIGSNNLGLLPVIEAIQARGQQVIMYGHICPPPIRDIVHSFIKVTHDA